MHEDVLETTTIFDGRIVHLKVHTVRLPDGQTSKRELIHHQGAVAVVAINQAMDVLLVRQYRIGASQILHEIPAGILEEAEDPAEAAARELREETGYKPLNLVSLGGMYVAPGYTTEYITLFYANGYDSAPLQQDEDEFIEAVRIPLLEALAMIDRGEIIDGKSVVGLLRVARLLGL